MGPDEAEENRRTWFFASCDLRNLHPDAVAVALQLRAETSGVRQFHESSSIDRQAADQLARDLDLAVRSGQIRFERVFESAPPPPVPMREYEAPPKLPERRKDQARESAPALDFIEVSLVDDTGSPLADQAYELKLPDGRVVAGTTDHRGRCWTPQTPSGACELKFPSLDPTAWG